jgi:hypothetical protein
MTSTETVITGGVPHGPEAPGITVLAGPPLAPATVTEIATKEYQTAVEEAGMIPGATGDGK